jgi:hypothetical protein
VALSQKGAAYEGRDAISNPSGSLREFAQHLVRGLDDLASQVQAVRTQGNYGPDGIIAPPSSPSLLVVTAQSGLFTATVGHANPPQGTQYVLQYSSTSNFQNPISETLHATSGIVTAWQKSLPGVKAYFRIAAKFPASSLGPWVYMGNANSPTLVG